MWPLSRYNKVGLESGRLWQIHVVERYPEDEIKQRKVTQPNTSWNVICEIFILERLMDNTFKDAEWHNWGHVKPSGGCVGSVPTWQACHLLRSYLGCNRKILPVHNHNIWLHLEGVSRWGQAHRLPQYAFWTQPEIKEIKTGSAFESYPECLLKYGEAHE